MGNPCIRDMFYAILILCIILLYNTIAVVDHSCDNFTAFKIIKYSKTAIPIIFRCFASKLKRKAVGLSMIEISYEKYSG